MRKILISVLFIGATSVFADGFSVFPTQVVFQNVGKSQEVTLLNASDSVLNTQSIARSYSQKNGPQKVLVESNSPISGTPAVITSPVVVKNVQPNSSQVIRMLAVKQNDESEIVYRYTIKNLNEQKLDSSGALFEIGYGIPVFILPRNVVESYNFSYTKDKGKSYIKIANVGNVHVMFKSISVTANGNKYDLGAPGRILAGNTQYLAIPAKIDSQLGTRFTISTSKPDLIQFEKDSALQVTITK